MTKKLTAGHKELPSNSFIFKSKRKILPESKIQVNNPLPKTAVKHTVQAKWPVPKKTT